VSEKVPGQPRTLGRRVWSAAKLIVINFLIFSVLAEAASLICVHWPNWLASRPNYRVNYNEFWVDSNPVFGVWHRPNGVFEHKGGCYDVTYYTNSYGARDVERTLHSSKGRTVMLGDSMIEGLGLPAEERLSNLLERDTGREHLNFGTGGDFGPLQYALLYKSMASAFDHDLVVVGVLADNDFLDMSYDYWKKNLDPNRYRPYYAADLSIFYSGHFDPNAGDGTWDHVEAWLRAYLASYHVGTYLYTRFHWARVKQRQYSGFNDYDDVDLARLKKSLEDIKNTANAHHARVAVILIPRTSDFVRLQLLGEDRLGPVMEQWGREVGIPIKDLLPEMNARIQGDGYLSYFLPCDGHWSAKGSATAAQILEPWLNEGKPGAN